MSEVTSTPNGGSKKDRSKYVEAKQKDVSWNELMENIAFDLNFIAVEFKDNVKTIGGDEETVEANSFATMEFDLKQLEEFGVNLSNIRNITPEKAEKIARRREKEKAKRRREKAALSEDKDKLTVDKKDDNVK